MIWSMILLITSFMHDKKTKAKYWFMSKRNKPWWVKFIRWNPRQPFLERCGVPADLFILTSVEIFNQLADEILTWGRNYINDQCIPPCTWWLCSECHCHPRLGTNFRWQVSCIRIMISMWNVSLALVSSFMHDKRAGKKGQRTKVKRNKPWRVRFIR
jgi:hypothetical protein